MKLLLSKRSLLNLKPTRRITKSHCSITGKKPSKKTGNTHRFESTLERDYITLLEFDDQVDYYVEQPVTIHYLHDGNDRIYTPDFLVVYKSSANIKPLLSEIKYKLDLQLHEAEYEPKFNAAIRFAEENGYQFSVITEDSIRNVCLKNYDFLNRYIHQEVNIEHASLLLTSLMGLEESTPEALIAKCGTTVNHKGELLYALWQLVAKRDISCDLKVPITMISKIWINPFLK